LILKKDYLEEKGDVLKWIIFFKLISSDLFREAIEAERRKEEYQRRHMAGETEAANRELAMLAIVRKRREEAKAKREAEGRKPGMSKAGLPEDFKLVNDEDDDGEDDDDDDEDEETKDSAGVDATKKVSAAPSIVPPTASEIALKKKEAALAPAPSTEDGPVKLKAMDIKKMNGDALKEHLKARNLDTQGQKKDLMKRLLDFEAARA